MPRHHLTNWSYVCGGEVFQRWRGFPTKTIGIDFGITGGKFEGSPRLGALPGLSFDF